MPPLTPFSRIIPPTSAQRPFSLVSVDSIIMSSSLKHTVSGPLVLLGGILTLGNLGTILHKSSRVYLFQQAQCFNYYQVHDATQINADYVVEEALCKVPPIQSRLSMVDGVDSFLQCLPRKPPLPLYV